MLNLLRAHAWITAGKASCWASERLGQFQLLCIARARAAMDRMRFDPDQVVFWTILALAAVLVATQGGLWA